jgi:2'-5' RNA ligase
MTKALDIVLLPSKDLWNELLEINSHLEEDWIDFKSGCVPHLTLAMGAVEEDAIISLWERISEDFASLTLKPEGVVCFPRIESTLCHLKFAASEELRKLHDRAVSEMHRFQKTLPERHMFYKGEAGEGTVSYARSFLDDFSGEKFDPHMTLGYGDSDYEMKKDNYTFSKLAICQLGDHNTCRDVLFETVGF